MNKITNCLMGIAGVIVSVPGHAVALPPPTLRDVPYGTHPRQTLDIWKAASESPTPVVFFIHGGGWVKGHKGEISGVDTLLSAGISVVSINYRFTWQAQIEGVQPPLEWPMRDVARALQFVRSKSSEWNLDRSRIAAAGASAGGCSSLWLAFHDEMSVPTSPDPIARESTRLSCVAAHIAQTSLDPLEMKKWTPNSRYGGHAFGFMDPNDLKSRDTRFAEFLERRQEVLPWIKEYSPIEHVSGEDPPVYLSYDSIPKIGKPQKDPTHTANFGVELQEKLIRAGVPVELAFPGAPARHASMVEFLVENLSSKAHTR